LWTCDIHLKNLCIKPSFYTVWCDFQVPKFKIFRGPRWESLQRSPDLLAGGEGARCPSPRTRGTLFEPTQTEALVDFIKEQQNTELEEREMQRLEKEKERQEAAAEKEKERQEREKERLFELEREKAEGQTCCWES